MNVCIATDGFAPQVGGIATFNSHLVSLLVKAGHSVIVLLTDHNNDGEDEVISESGFTKVVLKKKYHEYYKKWQPYFSPGGFNAPYWIATGMAMREWLLENHKKFSIDIVEVSDYGGAGIFLTNIQLPPVVITGHGSLSQFSGINYAIKDDHYRIVTKLEELSFQGADGVITHSPLNRENLEQLFKRPVHLAGIPWQHNSLPLPQTHTKQQLLVVGGLQPVKGVYTMAEAMDRLRIKAPSVKLFWIGGDTWLAQGQQLISLYLKKKYEQVWDHNFFWKGEQSFEKTQQDISSASLIIIPAVFETFNYVALEAVLYRKPLILTDKTGAAFLFTHGHDACIVPANNPDALAEAILHLLANPDLCHKLAENAYEMVQKKIVGEKIISDRISIYYLAIKNRITRKENDCPDLSFLEKYQTSGRRYYYAAKQFLKRIVLRKQ